MCFLGNLFIFKKLQQFITSENYLPKVPIAEKVVKEGVDLVQMQANLLQKMEDLPSINIRKQKEIDAMKKYFIILLTLIIIAGCSKELEFKSVYIDLALKAKYNFKKGSYWIYKDSISGRIDSFYLLQTNNYIPTSISHQRQLNEFLDIYIVQKIGTTLINDSIRWEIVLEARDKLLPSLVSFYFRKMLDTSITFYNFYTSNLLSNQRVIYNYNYTSTGGSMKLLDNFYLLGNVYNNVAEIHFGNVANNKNDCTYYFNDSVGYIKMHIHNEDTHNTINEVWELQRWYVIK